jgi:signal peptidase I
MRPAWRTVVLLASLGCGLAVAVERGVATRFLIQDRSMLPTLQPGDRVLVSALSLRLRPLRRGDLVVFRDPERSGRLAIKRVAGRPDRPRPGQSGRVSTVGPGPTPGSQASAGPLPTSRPLAPGELLVAGENLIESRDSRAYGPISRRRLVGRAWYRYWPPERRGRLPGETSPSFF